MFIEGHACSTDYGKEFFSNLNHLVSDPATASHVAAQFCRPQVWRIN